MTHHLETYTEEIFWRFKEIDQSAHREIISFYEHNSDAFNHLDLDEYLEVKLTYGSALFETGRYQHFIPLCDELIEEVIHHNIKYLNGEDIFEKLLFKKAAALYQQLELDEAENILWQLIRLNPRNTLAIYLLKRCKIKNQPVYLRSIKSFSIFLFLLAAVSIAFELLFIQHFYQSYKDSVEDFRNLIFISAIAILVLADAWHRLSSFHTVNRAVEKARRAKGV